MEHVPLNEDVFPEDEDFSIAMLVYAAGRIRGTGENVYF